MTKQPMGRTVRLVLAGVVLGALTVSIGPPRASVQAQDFGPITFRAIEREPLVIMDVSGYGIAGNLMHRHLTVYSDGLTSVATSTGFGRPNDVAVGVQFAVPGRARRLHRALLDLGALSQFDHVQSVADMATTTITVFGAARPHSGFNTFSFHVAEGDIADIVEELETYVAETLPDFKVP